VEGDSSDAQVSLAGVQGGSNLVGRQGRLPSVVAARTVVADRSLGVEG
jgi:hypothetical protein